MKKRFVVCIDESTELQNETFIEFLEETGIEWWHWINNVWLLVDPKGKSSSEVFRDKLCELYPDENTLVLELRGKEDTWSGFGPNSPEKNMFTWIYENW